jgi:hypothetical protein
MMALWAETGSLITCCKCVLVVTVLLIRVKYTFSFSLRLFLIFFGYACTVPVICARLLSLIEISPRYQMSRKSVLRHSSCWLRTNGRPETDRHGETNTCTPRRPGFDPGSVHVGFVVDKVALEQVFPRVLRFSPVNFIPPVLHYKEKRKN